MPKAIKRSPDKKPVGKKSETEEAKRRRQKNNTIITVAAILAVTAIAISVGYYVIYKMPIQRPIVKVNNETVKVSYLLKRCLLSSSDDIDSMITNIVYELVIEQAAPEYGIVVTEADIDQALKDGAKGTNESITDAEFQEWYRQELRTSQFSDKEFREVIRTGIIVQRLQAYLQDSLPTTAAQVYLHYLYVSDYDTAATIKQRIDAGEDFATIARELSLDENAKEDGGDKGWIPVHALAAVLESAVADLAIGKVSNPILINSLSSSATNGPYALLMVSEKAASMEVTDEYMEVLKGRVMEDWLSERMSTQTVKFYGKIYSGVPDSETEAWLQLQLEKMKKASGLEETTTTTTTTGQ